MVYRSSKMSVILSNVAINKNQLVSYVLEIILMCWLDRILHLKLKITIGDKVLYTR